MPTQKNNPIIFQEHIKINVARIKIMISGQY